MGRGNAVTCPESSEAKHIDTKLVAQLIFLAFPLFLSVDLDNISRFLDIAINVWKVISFLLLLATFIRLSMGRKLRLHLIVFIVLLIILFFATLLTQGSLVQYLIIWGGFFGVVLLIESYIERAPRELMLSLKITLGFLVLVNGVTVFLFPQGIWSIVHNEGWRVVNEGYWLFGHRNNFGAPVLAALLACFVSDFLFYGKMKSTTVVVAAVSLFSVIATWSATAVVTTVLAIALLAIISFRGDLGMIRPAYLLLSYAFVDIGVVFFGIQNWFSSLIQTLLHRSADLTGRSRLWDIVETKIWENPVIGHGVHVASDNGLTGYDPNYVHAHNGELDIVYNSGFLGLICYIIFLCMAVSRCAKYWESVIVQLAFFFLIFMMIHAITGLFFSSYTCLVLWLCLNAKALVDASRKNEGIRKGKRVNE